MASRLAGKVALITGAASQMGVAVAKKFVAAGAAKVILVDKTETKLMTTVANDINAGHSEAIAFTFEGDAADQVNIERAITKAEALKKVDIIYNHAAAVIMDPTTDSASFNDAMAANLRYLLTSIQLATEGKMMNPDGGSILCTAGTMGLLGDVTHSSSYSISNAAIMGVVRAAAADLDARKVRVNAITPNGVATSFHNSVLQKIFSGAQSDELAATVKKLWTNRVTEEDVASAAVFLASNDGMLFNGQNLELHRKFEFTI